MDDDARNKWILPWPRAKNQLIMLRRRTSRQSKDFYCSILKQFMKLSLLEIYYCNCRFLVNGQMILYQLILISVIANTNQLWTNQQMYGVFSKWLANHTFLVWKSLSFECHRVNVKERKVKKIQLGQFSFTAAAWKWSGCGFGHHYTHQYWCHRTSHASSVVFKCKTVRFKRTGKLIILNLPPW